MPVNKSLLRDLYYLCIWIEATLSKTYEKKKKRYAQSCGCERRKFIKDKD